MSFKLWPWLVVLSLLLVPMHVAAAGDVEGHWAEESILHLTAKRILAGFEDGTFRPDDMVTRSQFAKMLVAALGHSEEAEDTAGYPTIYRDIPRGHWSSGFVQVASDLGLVSGYGDGTFRGDNPITRVEITAMVVRALGQEDLANSLADQLPQFPDAGEIPEWARGYVQAALRVGAITGYEDGTLRPSIPTSRSEAATLLLRLLRWRGLDYECRGVIESISDGSINVSMDGRSRTFTPAPWAWIFRNGQKVDLDSLLPLDEVFMVGKPHSLTFIEAKYLDEVGEARSINAGAKSVGFRSGLTGATRAVHLEEDARVFRNGKPALLDDLDVGDRLYLVFASRTGRARIVDAAFFHFEGTIVEMDASGQVILRIDSGAEKRLDWASRYLIYLEGKPVSNSDIRVGDTMGVHLDESGHIDYAEASREVSQ